MRTLLALLLLVASCRNGVGPERCLSEADCAGDQVCLALASGGQVCADLCDATAQLVCEGKGYACVTVPAADASADVCYPAGALAVGATCSRTGDCVAGAVCVSRAGSTASRCERLCDATAGTGCAVGEACVALAGAPAFRGTCVIP